MPKRIDSNLKWSIGVPENNDVVAKPITPGTKKSENNRSKGGGRIRQKRNMTKKSVKREYNYYCCAHLLSSLLSIISCV